MRVEARGHGLITDEPLTREETADEFLLMGLRLAEGIDPAALSPRSPAARSIRERIAIAAREGLVETTPDGRLRVTAPAFRARCGGGGSGGLKQLTSRSAERARRRR